MKMPERSPAWFVAVSVVVASAACGKSRDGYTDPSTTFATDSGIEAAPAGCPSECSPDLRSVVDSCSGNVLETCAADRACGAKGCGDPCTAAADAKSSLGCEFLMQPPPTAPATSRSCYALVVVNGQPAPATLRMDYGGAEVALDKAVYQLGVGAAPPLKHTGPLLPGEAVVVFLSDAPQQGSEEHPTPCPLGVGAVTTEWPNPLATGFGKSFRLTTTGPVTASTIYPFGGATSYFPSATLLLPIVSWGKQHVVVSAWQRYGGPFGSDLGNPGFQLVATEDDTEVVIRPSKDISAGGGFPGAAEGVPQTFMLARGQALQVLQPDELTGSTIESTKPTSVFGGHSCMNIPDDTRCCCDSAQQQLPAIEQWGAEYAVVGHRPRVGTAETSPYRIVAAFDGTELEYEGEGLGSAPQQLHAGEVVTFTADRPFVARSQDTDHPFYLAEYMTGGGNATAFNGEGDPEFVNVVPSGQYLSDYTFYSDPTYTESSIVLVRRKGPRGFEDVSLDCAGGNVPGFAPLGTSGLFEFARVDLVVQGAGKSVLANDKKCGFGLQHLASRGLFAATLWGWSSYASYAYPGGVGQRRLVSRELVVR